MMNNINKKIKKAVVDSDLDGIVCASMLKRIFGDIEIRLSDPNSFQAGIDNEYIDKSTVIADLGYLDSCGMYFDHHRSNDPKKEVVGKWEEKNSAAEVIYDYYKEEYDLSKYEKLIYELGRFDSGLTTLEELNNLNDNLLLAFSVERRYKDFNHMLIDLLADLDWDEVIAHPEVKARLKRTRENILMYEKYVLENTRIIHNIAIVDNRGFTGNLIHAFFVAKNFLDVDVIIMIKKHKEDIRFTLFWNNFKKNGIKYDLLGVVKKMNPVGSGGHKGACGFTMMKGMEVNDTINIIINNLLGI